MYSLLFFIVLWLDFKPDKKVLNFNVEEDFSIYGEQDSYIRTTIKKMQKTCIGNIDS